MHDNNLLSPPKSLGSLVGSHGMLLDQSHSGVAVLLEIHHYHSVINIKASIIFEELLFMLI